MASVVLIAPAGKYRVVGVDTFDHTDWVSGDFDTQKEATDCAEKEGESMLKTHVYDDTGAHIASFGTF